MSPEHAVKILSIEKVTHNVKRFRCEKPGGYAFTPGQATEVSINKPGWINEKRPFTFTSLNEDPYLEFTIKIYRDHEGVTNELGKLSEQDELIIRDVWGAIEYKGPGYFFAGGAGITPFIAILRRLQKLNEMAGNKLFFSNKTAEDIIIRDELSGMMKENAVYVVTDATTTQYYNGYINEDFIRRNVENLKRNFYICGPPQMVESLTGILVKLGAVPDSVVFEK